MKYYQLFEYEYDFTQPIDFIWKRVSETHRLHEVIGSGIYTGVESRQKDNSLVRHCHKVHQHLTFNWTEGLSVWRVPYILIQQRDYTKPFSGSIRVEFFLSETPTGTHLYRKLIFWGDSLVGWLFVHLGINKKYSEVFRKGTIGLALSKEPHLAGEHFKSWKKPSYSLQQLKRVEKLIKETNDRTFGNKLAQKIADYVMYSMEIDVSHIRPIELAIKWNLPQEKVIEACLQSMELGLLEMRWDILCPQCRISKSETGSLHELPKSVHCDACNINFTLDFNKNIEMVFIPAKWLRSISPATFCMLSAQLTPHILIQYQIKPHHEEIIEQPLKPGNYRLRVFEDKQMLEFDIFPEDQEFPVFVLTDKNLTILSEKRPFLTFINKRKYAKFFIIEDLKFREHALTGQKVTTMNVFRRICPHQLIRPGENIAISQLTILFSDLVDSTAFYYEIGETKAYHIVREHFAFLSEHIDKNHGALIKTIGDSVMAVFYDPNDAVMACLAVHNHLAAFNKKYKVNLCIKLGLHQQNCIAVNFNKSMDYFGTAVNLAARLHGLSTGKDILVTQEMMNDPNVYSLLKDYKKSKCSESVKGVPDPINFYRIIP